MARSRVRQSGAEWRLRNMAEIQGSPGIGGLMRVAGAQASQVVALAVNGGGGGQTRVEHVALSASSQTIANGGGDVEWATIGVAPVERRGFASLDTIPVTDVPVDVTGAAIVTVDLTFASYADGGDVTVTRTRDGDEAVYTFEAGPVTSRFFTSTALGFEVQTGDTLTVGVPNSSGGNVTLSSANFDVFIIELAEATSGYEAPVYQTITDPTFSVPTGGGTTDLAGTNVLLIGGNPKVVDVTEAKQDDPGTGTTSVNIPSGTGGHLVIFASAAVGTGWNTPSGWTKLQEKTEGSGYDGTAAAFIRVSDGTEGSSVALSTSAYANTHILCAFRISGASSYASAAFSVDPNEGGDPETLVISSAALASGTALGLWAGICLNPTQASGSSAASLDLDDPTEQSDQYQNHNSRGDRMVVWSQLVSA